MRTALTIEARPPARLPCQEVTVTLHVHYKPGKNDEREKPLTIQADQRGLFDGVADDGD